MAKKIIGGIGSLLGIKKKKTAAAPATPATPAKGPVVTPLGGTPAPATIAAMLAARRTAPSQTLLSNKLGG